MLARARTVSRPLRDTMILSNRTSSIALSDAQMQALQKKIEKSTGKKVLLENKLDTSLLGGVKVCYAGKELDGTVSGRLESLRRSLTQA